MLERTRSVNGLSGYMPPHTMAIIFGLRARDADTIAAIAEHGPFCVSTDPAQGGASDTVRWLSSHRLAEPLGASAGRVSLHRASLAGGRSAARRDSSSRRRHMAEGAGISVAPDGQRPPHDVGDTGTAAPGSAAAPDAGLLRHAAVGRVAPGRRPLRPAPGNRSVGGRDGLAAGLGRNDRWTGRSGGAARSAAAMDRYSPSRPAACGRFDCASLAADRAAEWAVAEVRVRGTCEP